MASEPAPLIRGVWATVLLSLDGAGEIDLDTIDHQIGAYAAAGCDGIYANGTATEFHLQSEAQFAAVSRRTAEAARARAIPFQLGASHPLAPGALDRVAVTARLRPAAVQVTLPDWTAIDTDTVLRFLQGAAEAAGDVPLVLYNPPHARTVLSPEELDTICRALPALVGLKCGGGDAAWYKAMRPVLKRISVFIPGHHYASGVAAGAHGAYSNMACLSPAGAVRWALLTSEQPAVALDLERRIAGFMDEAIAPLLAAGFPGFACDKAMAAAGGWTSIAPRLLWPFPPVPDDAVARIGEAAKRHIPDFLEPADA